MPIMKIVADDVDRELCYHPNCTDQKGEEMEVASTEHEVVESDPTLRSEDICESFCYTCRELIGYYRVK